METFFVRIYPTRTGFMALPTEAETATLRRHFTYWQSRLADKHLILARPVPIDPGTFGIIILRADDRSVAEALLQADPAMAEHVMSYEIFPLRLSLYEGANSESR